MRSVTFVPRITIEVDGSVAQCAVYLGDVNGDGEYELVVGTTEGDLYIYKGSEGEVWKRASNLGFLTAVGLGDLLNIGREVLVAASGCGWLYIFDFSMYDLSEVEIEPTYRQRVPANIRDLIISDINNDGNSELVVSLTDRVVRMYRWKMEPVDRSPTDTEPKEVKDSSLPGSHESDNFTARPPIEGRFICINKWEFACQIGTISYNMDSEGNPAILIVQPGGAFMRLRCKKPEDGGLKGDAKDVLLETPVEKEEENEEEKKDDKEVIRYSVESPEDAIIASMSVEYEPMGIQRRSNPNVTAEILGGFHTGKDGPGTRYAIVTLDGSVLLVDDLSHKKPVDTIMWNLQVDHQLMCLSKLDITGDGLEEVVCCSWDGQTYIISQDKQAVRFQFEDSVSTFTAGKFTLGPGNTQPVLVYVTFNNKIQIYYDLCLGRDLTLSSLIHYPAMLQEAAESLKKLGCETGNLQHLQQVYSYCLYGIPSAGETETDEPIKLSTNNDH